MNQQRPSIVRPTATPWLGFLPYDHLLIVSPLPLDLARQRLQAFIDAQPQPKPFDGLIVGALGNQQAPYYRGTFHDDHVLLTGPYGYRSWEFRVDGHLSLQPSGTTLDVVIKLDGLDGYALLALGLVLCVPVVIGVLTTWWFGVITAGMVFMLMAVVIGSLQDALMSVRDRMIDLLAPVPRFSDQR